MDRRNVTILNRSAVPQQDNTGSAPMDFLDLIGGEESSPSKGFVITKENSPAFVGSKSEQSPVASKKSTEKADDILIEDIFSEETPQHIQIRKILSSYNVKGVSQIPNTIEGLMEMRGIGKKLAASILRAVVGIRPNE